MPKSIKRKKDKESTSWSSLPWKKLNLSIHGESTTTTTDEEIIKHINEEEFLNAKNHYDDPRADPNELYNTSDNRNMKDSTRKKSKRIKAGGGPREEEDEGADDPGILLGLDVIDGSKYRVEKVPSQTGGYVTRLIWNDPVNTTSTTATTTATKKPTHKQHVTNSIHTETRMDITTQGTTNRTQKQQHKQINNSNTEKKIQIQTNKDCTKVQPDVCCDQDTMEDIRTSWVVGTGGVYLHSHICYSLAKLGFTYPTPIQASTLAASILGKRDIAGAAPTGSGKTMAYCIPIVQFFLEHSVQNSHSIEPILTALILCPTRELALQVQSEFDKISRKLVFCGVIVGGLSEEKQKRILNVQRPPVLVATPGRLWSLMSSKDHKHLNELSQLRFLVVDEVDRMISKGNYPQLINIFDAINKANPIVLESEPAIQQTSMEEESDEDTRLKGLEGIPGESRVVMLNDDILRKIETQKHGHMVESMKQGFDEESSQSSIHFNSVPYNDSDESPSDESIASKDEIRHRQTFVFSATLSLPVSANRTIKTPSASKQKGKAAHAPETVENTIHDILQTAGARGQLKFVDLSSNPNNNHPCDKTVISVKPDSKVIQLPPGLSLYEIPCTKKHKDSYLYAFLVTTKQGSSGPCLVFCNSIAAVKRVSQTLRTLGLPVRTLHAHMEQKARLSAIESLKSSDSRVILCCSDVAARGLDLPSVANVIHYDVARTVDTFVHRAGRTARGVGLTAVGTSVSLVDPSEEKEHRKICESIRGQGIKRFEQPSMDGQLLSAAQTRVALATKIVDCDTMQSKVRKNNDWIKSAAAEADLDVDEDLLDHGPANGSLRDQQRLKVASKARIELKRLLAVPMKKQHFGKFLSSVGRGTGLEKIENNNKVCRR